MTLRELFEAELAALDRVLQWTTDEDVCGAIADDRAEIAALLARWGESSPLHPKSIQP